MKKAKIKRIVCVEPNGMIGVELYGMRSDLTFLYIDTKEIRKWSGTDENGYSIVYSLKENTEIFYDEISTYTRRICGVSFENRK